MPSRLARKSVVHRVASRARTRESAEKLIMYELPGAAGNVADGAIKRQAAASPEGIIDNGRKRNNVVIVHNST